MSPEVLRSCVTRESALLAGALALAAGWMGGATAALGVLAGAAIAIVNFRWLTSRLTAVLVGEAAGRVAGLALGLRLLGVGAACAGLLLSGAAHPVALVVGLTVLPCDLIARGLRSSEARS